MEKITISEYSEDLWYFFFFFQLRYISHTTKCILLGISPEGLEPVLSFPKKSFLASWDLAIRRGLVLAKVWFGAPRGRKQWFSSCDGKPWLPVTPHLWMSYIFELVTNVFQRTWGQASASSWRRSHPTPDRVTTMNLTFWPSSPSLV